MMQFMPLVMLAFIAQALAYVMENTNAEITSAVPVELFVMSKCPDAIACESTFAEVCEYHPISAT
jgi:hypothetical protein